MTASGRIIPDLLGTSKARAPGAVEAIDGSSPRECYLCLRNELLPMFPEWTAPQYLYSKGGYDYFEVMPSHTERFAKIFSAGAAFRF